MWRTERQDPKGRGQSSLTYEQAYDCWRGNASAVKGRARKNENT